MRTLTITREKSFVASLTKMKVYVEDPLLAEIMINDVPCRKIGVLKNGQTASFEVSNEALKIFVVADKLSTDYCSDLYELPAGNEDVFLSGKNKYDPSTFNAFRFNQNESSAALNNRKKGFRIGIVVLISSIILGSVAGYTATNNYFDNNEPKSKEFSDSGMTITLTDEFEKTEIANFTAAYASDDVIIFALKEDFTLAEGLEELSLEEYAEIVMEANAIDSASIKNDGGITYFDYVFYNTETKQTFKYYTYVFKTHDSFWVVQFATFEDSHEKYESQIKDWAASIDFAK